MIFELCWFSAKDVNANWLCGVHYRIKFHKSSRNPCIHSSKVSKVNFILVWNKKTCWCVRFSETLQFRTFFFIVQFICCCQQFYSVDTLQRTETWSAYEYSINCRLRFNGWCQTIANLELLLWFDDSRYERTEAQ